MNAADLEREGDQLRANMDRTLNEIERELSPDKLLDRSMDFVREHGGEFIREAGATVRNNPIPVLLTAAGVVWLTAAVASSSRSSTSDHHRRQWRGDGGHIDEDMGSFDEFAAGQGYANRSHESRKASGNVPSSRQAWRREIDHRESQLAQLVREQPIALGAIALAAGALLGAALPMTDYENRMMGAAAQKRPRSRNGSEQQSEQQPSAPSTASQTDGTSAAMTDE